MKNSQTSYSVSRSIGACIADTMFYSLAENAIQMAKTMVDLVDIIVFTDHPELGKNFTQVSTPKIDSIEAYNRIILECLPIYATSDFYLIIQYDGFPLNKAKFSEVFYDYDYIGAVWPQYTDSKVGNGGFSWRSLRLIKIIAELAYLREPGENEDIFICRTMRSRLENEHNIRFAPEAVAAQFSYEALGQNTDTFGFHGFLNLPAIYSNNPHYLLSNLPDIIIEKRLPELLWGGLLIKDNLKRDFDIELARKMSTIRKYY